MKQKILITGGAGFIGSHLCERLLNDGNDVLCVDNYFTGTKSNIVHLLDNHQFELMRHDVTFPLYVEVNQIYNYHFTGSPLWNLFSREAEMLENSYNLSVRCMFDIPRESHRYLVEGLTEKPHLKSTLIKRFLSFTEQIMKSPKKAIKDLYSTLKDDTQSVTGYNLRRIMLLVNKNTVDDTDSNDVIYMHKIWCFRP